LQRVPGW